MDKATQEKVKKAYATGFVTQAVVSGKTESEAKRLYKTASEKAEKIKAKHEAIKATILAG